MRSQQARGFTLVEVLVALVVVALGLAALLTTVSSAARTSGRLRDKTVAQWIALNRIAEVRLNQTKFGENRDLGELKFANRTWHYDTRYFDTGFATVRRVVVRVYEGDSKTKGNPVVEVTGFLGAALGIPGSSNVDWSQGSAVGTPAPGGNPALPGTPTVPGAAPTVPGGAPTTPTNPTPVIGAPGPTVGAPGPAPTSP